MDTTTLGTAIKNNPDGTFSVQTPTGARITKGPDGRVQLDIKQIKAVGVKNVVDVETHSINTLANSRSHFIRFHGGGELRFAYNQTGQLMEFDWDNLDITLTPNDELIFSRRQNEREAQHIGIPA